jgi:hypothetical protein
MMESQDYEQLDEHSSSVRSKRRRGATTSQINLKLAISLALSRDPKEKTAREILDWILEHYPGAKADRDESTWTGSVSGICSLGSGELNPWLGKVEFSASAKRKGKGMLAKWKYYLLSNNGLADYEVEYQHALRAAEEAADDSSEEAAEEDAKAAAADPAQEAVEEDAAKAMGESEEWTVRETPETPTRELANETMEIAGTITTNEMSHIDSDQLDLRAREAEPSALGELRAKWSTYGRVMPPQMSEDSDEYWGEDELDEEEEELLKFLDTDAELSRPDYSCKDLFAAHPELRPIPEETPKAVINFRKRSKRRLPDSTFEIISRPRIEPVVTTQGSDSNEDDSFFPKPPKFSNIESALRIPTYAIMALDDTRKHLIFKDANPVSLILANGSLLLITASEEQDYLPCWYTTKNVGRFL